ncbi:MAG: prolipoprotein diacylglyceryl transferase [Gammaproteobacteria bacterium]|nr:prolipoprotein diacylglyceryl transferase [Gammaproteobacteria bacterium]
MLQYPSINPVAFSLGPVAVHWYGLMYLVGFLGAWVLLTWRTRKFNSVWTKENVSDVIFYGALGVIIGGRVGYILFYNFGEFLHAPWTIFQVWKGGMSFHGGLMGVILMMWLYSRKVHKHLADLTDFIAPVVPIGLGAGRVGNFINGELWGRVTDVPWAMVYPQSGPQPRHPSELYEFLLEGVLFFIILWWFSSKSRPRYAVSGLFLLCYGVFRFFVEFFREPDVQIGYLFFNWMTMGQLLCVPMILIGAGMMAYAFGHFNDKS